jgi:hypothetical protein
MMELYLVIRPKDGQTMLIADTPEEMTKMLADAPEGAKAIRIGTAHPSVPEGWIGIVEFIDDTTGWINST